MTDPTDLRCPECGSWERECMSPALVSDCACNRCLRARLAEAVAREQLLLQRCDQLENDERNTDIELEQAEALLRWAREYVPAHDGYFHNPYIREADSCDVCQKRNRIDAFLGRDKP